MTDSTVAYMSTKYGVDIFDGVDQPQLVVAGDYVLSGVHQGSVHVEAGKFHLDGTHQGSLDVQTGVEVLISGSQQGSVKVAMGARVLITGSINGSAHVARGGTIIVESGGKFAGSLNNYGDVIVRGVFGGTTSGDRRVRLEGSGHIKQPSVRDGVNYYEW
jgi:cytoskeletal protein CcmA (bactofilin family)